jgi:hypothetical protein
MTSQNAVQLHVFVTPVPERELQDENSKRMYADLTLMHSALKDIVGRKIQPQNVGLKW